jgi:hypothetical protein
VSTSTKGEGRGRRDVAAAVGQARGMARPELDVSALYGLPLGEFTGARNELAKQARAQGDSDLAERIRGLQKPSLAAWTLNMLPRLREPELAALLAAGEEAERAQAGVLAGSGDTGGLQEATKRLRGAARSLAGEAGEILVKDGHAAREGTLLRVARSLETCAVTAEGRQRLREGRFAAEPEAAGFDLFAQLSTDSADKRAKGSARKSGQPTKPSARDTRTETRAAAQQAVAAARRDLRERRRERAAAEAATREAERVAKAMQREADQAWKLAERSRRRAERAQAAELEAKRRLDDALKRPKSGP